ncbi:MAG: hypothetical protein QOJ98_1936 [Acidobacteriota bacterium]|nr:hypothetical protein [Acidobacteriota bacterium]
MAGDLQVRVLERGRQAAMSPVTASRGVPEHTLGRVISPDPPGTTPDPLLPPSCTGSCRTRAKLARVGMRLLVELARGMGR